MIKRRLDTRSIKKGYKNNTYALRNKIIGDKKLYQKLLESNPDSKEYQAVLNEIESIEKVCIERGRY